ncbi:MAG: VOC family protein [Chloroflexota bacterium]
MSESTFVHTVYIRTQSTRLWDALTRPEETQRYFDFVEGLMAIESSWEPGTPIAYRTNDGQTHIKGDILEATAPQRLVTTMSVQAMQEEPFSQLSWDIVPMGEVCKLTCTHETNNAPLTAQEVAACMPLIMHNLKVLLETGHLPRLKAIIVDCENPPALATFWAAALDVNVVFANERLSSIVDPQGLIPEIEFQSVPEPKTVKNRLHFDIRATDREAEMQRLIGLGGKVIEQFKTWTVMADPEGHEFCIVTH